MQLPSSHFTFIVKLAPDYNFNHTGLAHHNFDRSFITHFIFTAFLLLFTIPIHVQAVNIYDRLHFHRWIHALFKNFHCIFQTVLGLYQLAQECCSLQSILIHLPEESPLTTILNLQKTPVPQQDQASTKSDCQQKNCETLAPQEITFLQLSEIFPTTQEHQKEPVPSESTTDHHQVNETPVHPVEPVLGTTLLENRGYKTETNPRISQTF